MECPSLTNDQLLSLLKESYPDGLTTKEADAFFKGIECILEFIENTEEASTPPPPPVYPISTETLDRIWDESERTPDCVVEMAKNFSSDVWAKIVCIFNSIYQISDISHFCILSPRDFLIIVLPPWAETEEGKDYWNSIYESLPKK
jgi:hypothetical protein